MKIKKTLESAILLSLVFAMIGCSSDNAEQSDSVARTHKVVLTGIFNEGASSKSATRMVYDTDSRLFNWETGDQITVYDEYGIASSTFTLTSGAGTNNGTFEGTFANGITPKYVTFGTMSLETGTGVINSTGMKYYSSISSSEGDIMAASVLTSTGTDTYSFALQHKLAYITNTTTSSYSSPLKTLSFTGTGLAGTITMNYKGETTVTPYSGKDYQLDMAKFDGTQYIVALPGGTITNVVCLYGDNAIDLSVWSGSKTLSGGKLLNFKKAITTKP